MMEGNPPHYPGGSNVGSSGYSTLEPPSYSVQPADTLDQLFYESVGLTEQLNKYLAETEDGEFERERDACREVLERELPG